ncbi:hypothetical protein [Jeotgalibaca porci]|uniref:hypothetical protein n=1 Tax=Jeotgalibaca porci TaxID=1868793 RepID=UPI0035A057B6
MSVIPIVSKMSHELQMADDVLFNLPYPLPKSSGNHNPIESRNNWKKKQKKALVNFLSSKK